MGNCRNLCIVVIYFHHLQVNSESMKKKKTDAIIVSLHVLLHIEVLPQHECGEKGAKINIMDLTHSTVQYLKLLY